MKGSHSMVLKAHVLSLGLTLFAASPALARHFHTPGPTPTSTIAPTPRVTPTATATSTPGTVSCNTTSTLARPIPLGVSGGNQDSIGGGFCCTGTLGSLVQDTAGTRYILSNNHVMVTADGQKSIIQPGLADLGCSQSAGAFDGVANLSKFVTISGTSNNKADAAIAAIIAGDVDTSGSILNVGPISSVPASAALSMPVQKMGRTSCVTTGTIAAVAVTVNVSYGNECDISFSGIATYTDQIQINGSGFSAGGDSGSLIVTRAPCPQPVGLLFAGSSSTTIANPVGDVFSALGGGLSFVGGCVAAAAPVPQAAAVLPGVNSMAVAATKAIKERHEGELMRIPGVLGVGVGISATGRVPTVKVLVDRYTTELRTRIPSSLEGADVQVEETGPIVAY